jgi:hypothetical protein
MKIANIATVDERPIPLRKFDSEEKQIKASRKADASTSSAAFTRGDILFGFTIVSITAMNMNMNSSSIFRRNDWINV